MGRIASSILLAVVIIWAGAPSHVRAVPQPPAPMAVGGDARFGINFVNSVDVNTALSPSVVSQRYRQATEAGAKWTRWPMYWHEIERSQGNRDYSRQDQVVDLDAANGLQTHVVLMGSPSWAATSGDPTAPFPKIGERWFKPLVTPSGVSLSSVVSPPKNLYLSWNDPSNYWGQFVYDTVRRYSSQVKVWEMWNEPDFSIFWSGSVADYYQLLKVGYQAAKAADAQATVLFAGLSFWSNQTFFPQVLNRAISDADGRGGGFFFDAVPWHPYIDPAYVYTWTQRARGQMQTTLGLTKPVWVNETNIPVCGEWATSCSSNATWQATLEEQASYVIQAYAYALAADVQRLSIFQLWDDGLAPAEYYGLAANSGAQRPAHRAYQVAATYLTNPTKVTRSPGNGYEMIVLEGTPQGKVTVVWATGSADVQAATPAVSAFAKLVDQNGNVADISPSGGYYRLTLPRATNNRDPATGRYIVGGKTYLLVETNPAQLASRISSLPEYASDWSFVVSWTRLDGTGTPATFDVQYGVGTRPDWVNWLIGTSSTSASFGPSSPVVPQEGQTYYFRSRLRAINGATEPYPDGDGDAHTTAPFALTGRVTDNRGIALLGARITATSLSTSSDGGGNYRLAVPPGAYDVGAGQYGYGIIPSRRLTVSSSLSYGFVLPPLNNYVQNWGFEGKLDGSEWWVPTGEVTTSTDWTHSGTRSAKLGEWNVSGDAILSQSDIPIPSGTYKPTVSFLYAVPSPAGAGDTFFLVVTSPRGTVSYPVPLDTQGAWAQKWFDLSSLTGPITLSFRLQKASANQLRVFLDEVSVGKASGGTNVLYFPQVFKN